MKYSFSFDLMKKYYVTVLLFLLLLILIIVFVYSGYLLSAKLTGIVLVVGFSVAIRIWMKQLKDSKPEPDSIKLTINHIYELNQIAPFLSSMPKSQKKELFLRLRKLIPQLNIRKSSGEDVSAEEFLAISLLITLVVWPEPYHSCLNKQILFVEENELDLVIKEEIPVLRISLNEVKKQLSAIPSLGEVSQIPEEYIQLYSKFYFY